MQGKNSRINSYASPEILILPLPLACSIRCGNIHRVAPDVESKLLEPTTPAITAVAVDTDTRLKKGLAFYAFNIPVDNQRCISRAASTILRMRAAAIGKSPAHI